MTKLKIYSKSKTLLVNELKKYADVEFVDFNKTEKMELDVYFHSGSINDAAITLIQDAKKVIVNSKSARSDILSQLKIDEDKIDVIYPAIKEPTLKPKDAKKQLCKEFNFDKKTKVIFFTARTLKTNGVKEFFDTIMCLTNDNYKIIVASDEEQITTLKFQIAKYKMDDKIKHSIYD